MPSGSAVFLDTSIQIARVVHSAATKRRIQRRIGLYSITVTSEVVKQEFKRRLLKEARYLLGLINETGSLSGVYDRVLRLSHPGHKRKREIGLAMMRFVFDNEGEAELTERFKLYLHYLLTNGLDEFEAGVGQVNRELGCACAKIGVKEKVAFKRYEFGPDECSHPQAAGCGVEAYLRNQGPRLQAILDYLHSLPYGDKSAELTNAESFIQDVLKDPAVANGKDPCSTVGDLLIALESIGIPDFFTLNGKESQHLCRPLGQDLIVRPSNPEHDDIECHQSNPNWHKF